jgi:wyosine [tRNA(Phe)-imidazoG37] synthetase (radical SAM superfamily)
MKQAIDEIQPEKVHLNTVIRPPAYSFAKPVSNERLREIQKILGERSEIIGVFKEKHKTEERNADGEAILALLKRRAMTVDQMVVSMAMKREEIISSLEQLLQGKFIRSYVFNGEEFYQVQ